LAELFQERFGIRYPPVFEANFRPEFLFPTASIRFKSFLSQMHFKGELLYQIPNSNPKLKRFFKLN